jgi:hypothetical protein
MLQARFGQNNGAVNRVVARMTLFQAAVGPDQSRMHIYIVGTDPKMSLCNRVCCARNYKADVVLSHPKVCGGCRTKFLTIWCAENPQRERCISIPADTLGVSSLII